MHNFSELSDSPDTTSFIPVCISLFRYIVSLKYGRSLPVQGDNEANQVMANSEQSDAKSGSYIQYPLNSLNG